MCVVCKLRKPQKHIQNLSFVKKAKNNHSHKTASMNNDALAPKSLHNTQKLQNSLSSIVEKLIDFSKVSENLKELLQISEKPRKHNFVKVSALFGSLNNHLLAPESLHKRQNFEKAS